MSIPGVLSTDQYFVKDMNKDRGGTTTKNTKDSSAKVQLDGEDTSSTRAIHPPKHGRTHPPNRSHKYRQAIPPDSSTVMCGILQTRNGVHSRQSSLSSSLLSSSILSSVFEYFGSPSPAAASSSIAGTNDSTTERHVSFSLQEQQESSNDAIDTCRRHLNFSNEDTSAVEKKKKTHRRCQAEMCMSAILFELDIFDFEPRVFRGKDSIPTLICVPIRKKKKQNNGNRRQVKHASPQHHGRSPSRHCPFTI